MKKLRSYHNESMWKGAPFENFKLASQLKLSMTEAELTVWERLKNKQFRGYKFRRQHPIHLFIVDFYCHELKLILEIDGEYHEKPEQRLADKERSELLEYQGLSIIRFTNEEVLNSMDLVLKKLEEKINSLPQP